ncbi:MAG TPA: CHAD domain-containing protein [Candidatus Limnocylindrales bacterium]|nr:CHAD domain-containing protein [Candidatus Limnocylindrales bacterium]
MPLPGPARADEELELKYTIDDPGAAEGWFDEHYPDREGWRTVRMVDRYFDTAGRALFDAGYGARLRQVGRKTVLTLKSDIDVTDGRHQRLELEGHATQELDVNAWKPSAARDRVAEVVGERRLIELFLVRQKRRERPISVDGAELMVSIDLGKVVAAGREVGPIVQLEVEHLRGRRVPLDEVARQIREAGIGRPESRSKLAMAHELAEAASVVAADDKLAEAGRKVLRRHLVRLLSREPGARDGDELETKQMRVATRRLRATWGVFADAFKARVARERQHALRDIGRAIGEVRDLDVLIATVENKPALTPLTDSWRAQRAAAHDDLVRLLDSKRYRRFVDEMLEFTASPGKGARRKRGSRPVAEAISTALQTAVESLHVTESLTPQTADVDAAWHARRIEARRLRYSVEAFLDVLDETPSRKLLDSITRLQDRLGALQDGTVAMEKVGGWLDEQDGALPEELQSAVDAYLDRRLRDVEKSRIGLDAAWSALMTQAEALTKR